MHEAAFSQVLFGEHSDCLSASFLDKYVVPARDRIEHYDIRRLFDHDSTIPLPYGQYSRLFGIHTRVEGVLKIFGPPVADLSSPKY